MVFKPLTSKDFAYLSGSLTGANSIHRRLSLLRYGINVYLKERNVSFSSVVADPKISRGKDIRRMGWLGYLSENERPIVQDANPLASQPSVSVLILGEENCLGEEAGLQVVIEFGEEHRCQDERDSFRLMIQNSGILEYSFLGGGAALRYRRIPESTKALDSSVSLSAFLRSGSDYYDVEEHYIVLGWFYTIEKAVSFGDGLVDTVAENVRRLLILYGKFKRAAT